MSGRPLGRGGDNNGGLDETRQANPSRWGRSGGERNMNAMSPGMDWWRVWRFWLGCLPCGCRGVGSDP